MSPCIWAALSVVKASHLNYPKFLHYCTSPIYHVCTLGQTHTAISELIPVHTFKLILDFCVESMQRLCASFQHCCEHLNMCVVCVQQLIVSLLQFIQKMKKCIGGNDNTEWATFCWWRWSWFDILTVQIYRSTSPLQTACLCY